MGSWGVTRKSELGKLQNGVPGTETGSDVTDGLCAVLHPVVLTGTGEMIYAAVRDACPPSKHRGLVLDSCVAGVCNSMATGSCSSDCLRLIEPGATSNGEQKQSAILLGGY